jgi:hypothetical protein
VKIEARGETKMATIRIRPSLYRDEEAFTEAVVELKTRHLERVSPYDSYRTAQRKSRAIAVAAAEARALAREIWMDWLERIEDRFERGLYED